MLHCSYKAEQRTEQPTSETTADQHRLGSVSTVETSIRCKSLSTTVHLTTGPTSSTTSMDRDIATTAVPEMDPGRLSLRDDTSGHRRYLEGQYSNQQLAWTTTILQARPHHTWAEVRQMIDNFFANSYTHLPGQTIGNIDQDINIIKNNKKGKGKKGNIRKKLKARDTTATTTTTTTTTTTLTTTNNNHNRKEKQKEKVPSGATTTTPARANIQGLTRTTTKERGSLHRLPRLHSAKVKRGRQKGTGRKTSENVMTNRSPSPPIPFCQSPPCPSH